METYDIIVIGGGHNALVSAACLTKAGKSVLVLNKNDRPGSFVRTDEILHGYRYDPLSASHPLFTTAPHTRTLERTLRPAACATSTLTCRLTSRWRTARPP
jgi:phytoene dehydrogenase-like protein